MGNSKSKTRYPGPDRIIAGLYPTLPAEIAPRGLEDLISTERLWINQVREPVAFATGYEIPKIYNILTGGAGKYTFVAHEVEPHLVWNRVIFGQRPFEMSVMDSQHEEEVLAIYRPFRFCSQELSVYCPSAGNVYLGSVKKKISLINPHWEIANAAYIPILKISGPGLAWLVGMANNLQFEITTMNGATVGYINKDDNKISHYEITFVVDMPAIKKALIMAATMLIDFTVCER